MSTTRQYELVYIVKPDASDQEVADLHTQVEQIVQRFNATFDKTENWGRRKLAYEIGHHREGTYVVETISGSGDVMKEIDRRGAAGRRAHARGTESQPGAPPRGARAAAGAGAG
jgi:small subunit ribosomal protein S6